MSDRFTVVVCREGEDGAIAMVGDQRVLFAASAADDSHPLQAPTSTHLYLSFARYASVAPSHLVLWGEVRQGPPGERARFLRGFERKIEVHEAFEFGGDIPVVPSSNPNLPSGLRETVELAVRAYQLLSGLMVTQEPSEVGIPFQHLTQIRKQTLTSYTWSSIQDVFLAGAPLPMVAGTLGWPRIIERRAVLEHARDGEPLIDLLPLAWREAVPATMRRLRCAVRPLAFDTSGLINNSTDLALFMEKVNAPYALIEGALCEFTL